jgi:hypothetical protein
MLMEWWTKSARNFDRFFFFFFLFFFFFVFFFFFLFVWFFPDLPLSTHTHTHTHSHSSVAHCQEHQVTAQSVREQRQHRGTIVVWLVVATERLSGVRGATITAAASLTIIAVVNVVVFDSDSKLNGTLCSQPQRQQGPRGDTRQAQVWLRCIGRVARTRVATTQRRTTALRRRWPVGRRVADLWARSLSDG